MSLYFVSLLYFNYKTTSSLCLGVITGQMGPQDETNSCRIDGGLNWSELCELCVPFCHLPGIRKLKNVVTGVCLSTLDMQVSALFWFSRESLWVIFVIWAQFCHMDNNANRQQSWHGHAHKHLHKMPLELLGYLQYFIYKLEINTFKSLLGFILDTLRFLPLYCGVSSSCEH